jgi:hypothetical protein
VVISCALICLLAAFVADSFTVPVHSPPQQQQRSPVPVQWQKHTSIAAAHINMNINGSKTREKYRLLNLQTIETPRIVIGGAVGDFV